eukprot:6131774-Pyramimonas_sp.AAC.1
MKTTQWPSRSKKGSRTEGVAGGGRAPAGQRVGLARGGGGAVSLARRPLGGAVPLARGALGGAVPLGGALRAGEGVEEGALRARGHRGSNASQYMYVHNSTVDGVTWFRFDEGVG